MLTSGQGRYIYRKVEKDTLVIVGTMKQETGNYDYE